MRHLGWIGFFLRNRVRGANVILTGAVRHLEYLVRIELPSGHRDGQAPLAGFLVLTASLFGFALACLFAFALLLTAAPGVFFFLGLLQTLFFLAFRLLLLPLPFFFLGALLVRALGDRAPDGFRRFVPAFLTKVA
jgi:hypothetical protein